MLVWDRQRGLALVWARAVVLATGGAGQLFRETTNPPIATADGHAMAYRAGAELRDMEFMQFHPTVLYMAGSTRHLLTEALRGEGAYLRDCHGERFMPGYHPLAELAPRDDVSLAIAAQMAKTSTRASTSTSRTSTPSGFAVDSQASTDSAGPSTSTSRATRSPSARELIT